MLKRLFRRLSYLLLACLPLVLAASIGSYYSMQIAMSMRNNNPNIQIQLKHHNAQKPTAVIVLGNTVSEITDVLAPYALLAKTGLYNLYIVAETTSVRSLSGGLDVLPDHSFASLAALLTQPPALIIVPAITEIQASENQPVLAWLRQQRQPASLLMAWCTGAEVLAESGLLNGLPATAHWADLGSLAQRYPQVQWQNNQRYVDTNQQIITTAGLTSGIDATLYFLQKTHGLAVSQQLAQTINYSDQRYLASATMQAYSIAPSDSVYLLNAAFYWPKQTMGIWLEQGIDELALAAFFDVYTGSWVYDFRTIAAEPSVRSAHGLQLVPRFQAEAAPPIDRLLGFGDNKQAQPWAQQHNIGYESIDLAQHSNYFGLALERFARDQDQASAQFAAKRMEYRQPLALQGSVWPWRTLSWLGLWLGVGLGACYGRWRISKRKSATTTT
ncbi:DJ-1/PfpI family protein [Herpetosiphon llansteffanensis]|uniref:DJ-1/PfpI family protein n=1 Tax=Herpetosiphon llansteffanensis TaxID=2094568 RepID=UPI000D7D046D|nr:DJ-1/PfpI family protein [Herpetosiphon llansteffanensis]